MNFSINIPYRQRIIFQVRIQKLSVSRKKINLEKAAARQTLNQAIELKIRDSREKFYL